MKKILSYLFYSFILLSSLSFICCNSSSSEDSEKDDINSNSIYGQWMGYDGDETMIWDLYKDGTYCWNENGNKFYGEFEYDSSKGTIILYDENGEIDEFITIIQISSNKMILKIDGNEFFEFTRIDNDTSNNENTEVPFYIGKWRYQFYEDGYVLYTFNTNGTGSYYEWDNGSIDGNEKFTYLWDEKTNRISFISENGESIVVEYKKISNKSIIVYDFGDSEEIWIKE